MKHVIVVLVAMLLAVPMFATEGKPVVFISGTGNISIASDSVGAAGFVGNNAAVAGRSGRAAVNKHDQTMEMAGVLLESCPGITMTLDQGAQADYTIALNREGTPTIFGEVGKSQVMAVNAKHAPIFVSKTQTVKNATKQACAAVLADWQANGRIVADKLTQPQNATKQKPQTTPMLKGERITLAEIDGLAFPKSVEEVYTDGSIVVSREKNGYRVVATTQGRSELQHVTRANEALALVEKYRIVSEDSKPQVKEVVAQQAEQELQHADSVTPIYEYDVAVVIHTTQRATKYCKPETISAVVDDLPKYLTSKGYVVGPVDKAEIIISVTIDRPITKWVELTVEAKSARGETLLNERVSDSGWGRLGTIGLENTLSKAHKLIDERLPKATQEVEVQEPAK